MALLHSHTQNQQTRRISCVDILNIVDIQGSPQFCRLGSVPNVAHLRFIQEHVIGVSVVNNLNIPSIIRWSDMKVDKLLREPDLEVRLFPTSGIAI